MWAFTYGFSCKGNEKVEKYWILIDYMPSFMIQIALTLNLRVWASFYIRIGKMSSNPLRWSGAFTDFIDKYLPEYDKELEKKVEQMKNNANKQTKNVIIMFWTFLVVTTCSFIVCFVFDVKQYKNIEYN